MLLIWIESVRGFVQDEHIRIVNDRLGKTGAMTKTFRKGIHALIQDRLQKAHLHDPRHRLLAGVSTQPAQFRAETQKTSHRHIAIHRRVFRQVTNHPLRRDGIGCHVKTADGYFAIRRRNEPGDHSHAGGFPRAIRSEEPEHLSPLNVKGKVVDRYF